MIGSTIIVFSSYTFFLTSGRWLILSVFAFQPFSRISVPIGYILSFYSSTGRPHYKSSPDSLQVLLRILAESLYTSPQMQRPIIVLDALRYNFIYLSVVVWYKCNNYLLLSKQNFKKI